MSKNYIINNCHSVSFNKTVESVKIKCKLLMENYYLYHWNWIVKEDHKVIVVRRSISQWKNEFSAGVWMDLDRLCSGSLKMAGNDS